MRREQHTYLSCNHIACKFSIKSRSSLGESKVPCLPFGIGLCCGLSFLTTTSWIWELGNLSFDTVCLSPPSLSSSVPILICRFESELESLYSDGNSSPSFYMSIWSTGSSISFLIFLFSSYSKS